MFYDVKPIQCFVLPGIFVDKHKGNRRVVEDQDIGHASAMTTTAEQDDLFCSLIHLRMAKSVSDDSANMLDLRSLKTRPAGKVDSAKGQVHGDRVVRPLLGIHGHRMDGKKQGSRLDTPPFKGLTQRVSEFGVCLLYTSPSPRDRS